MANVLHGSARTTPHLRAEFQASKESSRALAARYGLNAKTVPQMAQADHNGRRAHGSEEAEEHGADAGRGGHRGESVPAEKTLLPLDDVLGCLRDAIPHLSRSALHRCLQRHGVSRLPIEETKEQRKRFKTYEIGYVHIDSCELRHARDGKLVMFLAIDRVSKFTFTSSSTTARARWRARPSSATPCRSSPYKIHTVLTDNGMAFADYPRTGTAPAAASWAPTS